MTVRDALWTAARRGPSYVRQEQRAEQPDEGAAGRQSAELTLIESTPSLRARLHQKRDALRGRVAEALAERDGLDAFTADVLTAAAAAALDAAIRAWAGSGGTADRGGLVDRAFATLWPGGA